jgi:hypothetical protein
MKSGFKTKTNLIFLLVRRNHFILIGIAIKCCIYNNNIDKLTQINIGGSSESRKRNASVS